MKAIIENGKQESISLEKIRKNPLNSYDMVDLEDLKNSIMTYGLITPVSVIGPDANDEYILIAGERRLNIFQELFESGEEKYKELPAYIVGDIDMSETEQRLLIEASNLDTRDGFDKHVHYLQVIKLLHQYKEENGLNLPEYIKLREQYLKCSPRYARYYEAIFKKGSEELVSMVEKGEVSVSRAGRIASMPEDIQNSAIEELKAGKNQDEVVDKYSKLSNKEKPKKKERDEFDYAADLDEDFDSFDDFGSEMDSDGFGDMEIEEDYDDFDFNDMSTDFLSTDTTNSISGMKSKKEADVQAVIQWCKKILKVTNPSDEEWEAIEACKKVAETF